LNLRFPIIFNRFFLCLCFLFSGTLILWANPAENVDPDQPIYQRVKNLERYGLLDPQDQEVLDQGKTVTRLELAFYTEKAKARIEAPVLGPASNVQLTPTPTVAVPIVATPTLSVPSVPGPPEVAPPSLQPPTIPGPAVVVPEIPTSTPTQATILPPTIPAPAVAPPTIPTAPLPVSDAVKKEIEDLLKELHSESAYLRSRLSLDDARIKEQEDELNKLKPIQAEVDAAALRANHAVGSPNFSSVEKVRVENLHLSGIADISATKAVNDMTLGMWSDLGGKGSISVGMETDLSFSNATEPGPVSVFSWAPAVDFKLNGPLGNWDTNVMVEGYNSDTNLGDFIRGISPTSLTRFEHPFDVKDFSTDQNSKIWDDYMNSVGFVATSTLTAGNVQNPNVRVFDGLFMTGSNLPGVSPDARLNFLVGRMGTTSTQTQRWEESLKYAQPWADGLLRTSIGTIWVNDNFGVNQIPQLDMKDYSAEIGLNLAPVYFNFEGALSHFYTGLDLLHPTNPSPIDAPGGQASVAFYPFTAYYTAISDNYANFQSKVMMSGINFAQYGMSGMTFDKAGDMYGAVGEVNDLISDRYGWRLNFGWNGRQQTWMKKWPKFLDDIIINFDVAQKTEYRTVYSPEGYNVIEPFNMLTFYYPDDEGLWGLNLWGGYGGGATGAYAVRSDFMSNIQAIRNDNNTNYDDVRYQFQLSSERIPLIVPVQLDGNGNPVTYTIGPKAGQNQYLLLDDLKTYNYITLTTKWQLYKTIGFTRPLDLSFFFTDNQVSGVGTAVTQNNIPANIPNLFEQVVYDGCLMVQAVKSVNLLFDYGMETWKCDYTWPLINYQTEAIGGGLAWDLPWCGGKLEARYKHITFTDTYVTKNDYQGDQVFSTLQLLF